MTFHAAGFDEMMPRPAGKLRLQTERSARFEERHDLAEHCGYFIHRAALRELRPMRHDEPVSRPGFTCQRFHSGQQVLPRLLQTAASPPGEKHFSQPALLFGQRRRRLPNTLMKLLELLRSVSGGGVSVPKLGPMRLRA
jgi:hypothetical protein